MPSYPNIDTAGKFLIKVRNPRISSVPVEAVTAAYTTAIDGDNNDFVITAKTGGAEGNNIYFTIADRPNVNGRESQDASVMFIDLNPKYKLVKVYLETNALGESQAISVSDLITLVNEDENNVYVTLSLKADNTGVGTHTAWDDVVQLTGGVNGTPWTKGKGIVHVDTDNDVIYVATANCSEAVTYYKKCSITDLT